MSRVAEAMPPGSWRSRRNDHGGIDIRGRHSEESVIHVADVHGIGTGRVQTVAVVREVVGFGAVASVGFVRFFLTLLVR